MYSGIRPEYVRNTANTGRIQPLGRSFGIRGKVEYVFT
jgi:hypothetical protein